MCVCECECRLKRVNFCSYANTLLHQMEKVYEIYANFTVFFSLALCQIKQIHIVMPHFLSTLGIWFTCRVIGQQMLNLYKQKLEEN